MSDPKDDLAPEPGARRRLQRGHGGHASGIPEIYEDKIARQIDPEAFAAFTQRLDAFAQRRFGPILPQLGKAFFKGSSSEEVRDKGLQAAFINWALYGFQDPQGLRIVDMFAASGLHKEPEIGRALNAARHARFRVLAVGELDPQTQQIECVDLMREEPITFLDKNTFAFANHEDLLCGWIFPSGLLSRPLGLCTRVPKVAANPVRAALASLAEAEGMTMPELADRLSMKVFWLIYRAAVLAP